MQAVVSLILVVINFFASGGVQEAFQTMLSLAVVLQLVPFLYVFAALIRSSPCRKTDSKAAATAGNLLLFAGVSGLHHHDSGYRAGLFPGEADYLGLEIRTQDVRHHRGLSRCWPRFSSSSMAA